MRAAKQQSIAGSLPKGKSAAVRSHQAKTTAKDLSQWLLLAKKKKTISSKDITFVFRNVSTLLENGVSLPKALGALADERAMDNCRDLLLGLRKKLETGASLSGALAQFGESFDTVTINQIKVGERSGTLGETLANIATQREKSGKLKGEVIKKLSYPAMLVVIGSGVITFLLAYVVPVFEETYNSAKVPLPGITQTLIIVGHVVQNYWMVALLAVAGSCFGYAQIRKNHRLAQKMDAGCLRLPLVGDWIRDVAILELMEVLGNLMEAGFTLAEALGEAGDSV